MSGNALQRRTFLKMSAATAALALTGCVEGSGGSALGTTAESTEDRRLLEFFSRSFNRELDASPEFLTFLGNRKRYGEWNDYSEAFIDQTFRDTQADTSFMRTQIDRAKLSPGMRVSYDIFLFRNEQRLANYPFRFHNYDVSHFNGPHQNIPNLLINQHRIENVEDAVAYVDRLNGTGRLMDQTIDMLRKSQARGITLPRFSYALLRSDAAKVVQGAPFRGRGENNIFADFRTKVGKLSIPEARKAELVGSARKALLETVGPAYRRFDAAVAAIARTSKSDHGAGTLPDGAAFYNERIAAHTTLNIPAEEIHALGLSEVARLSKEMEEVKARLGFRGPLRAFYNDLRTNPRYLYPSTDQGRSDYLTRALALQREAYAALPKAFGFIPRTGVEVKRMESFLESGQTIAFYNSGSPDGTRPGFVFYNLASMRALPKWQMAALAFHEGIPGHHMQISVAQETKSIPDFRKYTGFTAYVEGWALYTEYLAKEMGLYHDDLDEVGRITMELWRACRLVVDTGIHAKGWSRRRSVNYFLANTALTRDNIVREIDRYFVFPGQACAYQIGRNRILELREKARATLGDAFDLRAFHDTVLQNGAVPLPVLESIVEDWVRSRAAPV